MRGFKTSHFRALLAFVALFAVGPLTPVPGQTATIINPPTDTLAGGSPGSSPAIFGLSGQGFFAVVGPANSNYPVIAGDVDADTEIQAALAACKAGGGGIVLLGGGPTVSLLTSSTINALENVDIWSDGCGVKPAPGTAFTPVIGNLPGQTLTSLIYLGLPLNAAGSTAGYTAQPLTIATGVNLVFPALVGTFAPGAGTIVVQASGAATGVTQNGLTMSNAGPWLVTPADTFNATFGAITFTFTQLVEGWYSFNTRSCRWIGCGPWNGQVAVAQYASGFCFTLDAGTVQVSASNKIDIFSTAAALPSWAGGFRFNGSVTFPTANNEVNTFAMQGVQFRGADIAQRADTTTVGLFRAPKVGAVTPYVGIWVGSAGTAGTPATCDRTFFIGQTLLDSVGGSDAPIVLGYYNVAGGLVFPAGKFLGVFASTKNPVTDLRVPAVPDYDLECTTASIKLSAAATGQSAVAAAKQGLSNQVVFPASGSSTPVLSVKQTLYIKTVGGLTAITMTDPNGTVLSVLSEFIVGGVLIVPPGAFLTPTWTVTIPTWTSYLGG
jgi:hypothetical protein